VTPPVIKDNGIDVDRDDIHDSTYQLAVEFSLITYLDQLMIILG